MEVDQSYSLGTSIYLKKFGHGMWFWWF